MATKKAKSAAPAEPETTEIPGVGEEVKTNEFEQAAAVAASQEAGKKMKGDWVTMTVEQVEAYQKSGDLMGYNPKTKQGLLKKKVKKIVDPQEEVEQ